MARKPIERDRFNLLTLQRWCLYATLVLVIIWIKINSFDSAIVKTPLLVTCASLLLALFIAQALQRGKLQMQRASADVLVLAFLLVSIISTTASWNPASSRDALLLLSACCICYWAGMHLFSEKIHYENLIRTLMLTMIVVCLVGFVQFLIPQELGIDFNLGSDRRVVSTLGNANFLSGLVVVLFPLFLGQAIRKSGGRIERVVLVVLLLAMTALLFLTQTRSSIIAFLLSVFVLVVVLRPNKRAIFVGTAGLAALAVLVLLFAPALADRLRALVTLEGSISLERRMVFWKAGIDGLAASPLLGHGVGSHESVILQYRTPDYWRVGSEDLVPHAHNEFLEVAVEQGFAGLVCYVAIIGVVFWKGSIALKSHTGWRHTALASLLCSLAAIVTDNVTNVSMRQAPVAAVTWLLMGLTMSSLFHEGSFTRLQFRVPGAKWVIWIPLALWVASVYWYGRIQLGRFESDSHVVDGNYAESVGRRVVAINEFREAATANPYNLVAKLNLSLGLVRMEKHAEALRVATELRTISPAFPKSALVEALALMGLGRLDEAQESIRRELAVRNPPEVYYVQSQIFEKQGNTAGAREALENVLVRNIAAHTQSYLDPSCKKLLQIAREKQHYDRLHALLLELTKMFPGNKTVAESIDRVKKVIQGEDSKLLQ